MKVSFKNCIKRYNTDINPKDTYAVLFKLKYRLDIIDIYI